MRLAKLLEMVDMQDLHQRQDVFRRSLLGKTLYHGSKAFKQVSIERDGLTSEYNFFVLEEYGWGWDRYKEASDWVQVAVVVDERILDRIFPDPEMFGLALDGRLHTGESAIQAGLLDDPEALLKMYSEMPTAEKGCQIVVKGAIAPALINILVWDDSRSYEP